MKLRAISTGRLVQAGVLLAWLGTYLWLLAGNRYQEYLAPALRPLLVGALVVLAVLSIAAMLPAARAQHSARGVTIWVRGVIMILPLLYMGASHNYALDSYAAGKRSLGATRIPGNAIIRRARPASHQLGGELTITEILADRDRQVGQHVITEGMVFRGKDVPPGCFALFRFVITCCAADAQPAAVLVSYPSPERLESDEWLRVEGRLTLKEVDGEAAACIEADRVTPIPPPKNPFLTAF
jgi:putative membrane protein